MAQLVTTKKLIEIVQENKITKRMLLIHGVFDILHEGHLSAIKYAKKHCDIILVGIESDELTTKIKGPKRPVNRANQRARAMCNIDIVDYVFYLPITHNMDFDDHSHPYYKLKRKLGVPVVISKNADDNFEKRLKQERLNGLEVFIDPTPRLNSTTKMLEKNLKLS